MSSSISDFSNSDVFEETINAAISYSHNVLQSLALDADFLTSVSIAFGTNFDIRKLERIQDLLKSNDFSEFPKIELISGEKLKGANAAYSRDTGKIYLSTEHVSQNINDIQAISASITEEIGHHIDAQINSKDAIGDEGKIIQILAFNESLTDSQLQELRLEDDSDIIILDGEEIDIEKSSISDSGGFEGSQKTIKLDSKGGGKATFRYEHFFIPDNFIIRYEGKNILETGFVGGRRTGTVQIPEGESNQLEVIVTTNDQGTAWNYDVTVDTCADTTPLNIEVAGGEFEDTDDDGDCDAQGTIYIGRTDGIARMLRVEGASAEYDDKSLRVTGGTVFSEIGGVSTPLFRGSFEIPIGSATTSSLSDDLGNAASDFRLGGLDVNVTKLSLNRNSIGLGSDFKLPDDVGGIEINSLALGIDTVSIRQNGVSLGPSGKLSLSDPPKFSFFKLFDVEASGLALEYDGPEEKLKLQGKFTLDSFIKDSVINKVTADLSGANFVEIDDGKADIKGSLIVETDLKTSKGWGLKEVRLDVDTVAKDVGGSTKLTFPFKGQISEAELGLGFKLPIPPLELNKVSVNVDNLQVPIPGYPLVFFQRFGGAVENFAPSDSDPIEFSGGVGATLGPQVNIPGLGNLALIRLDVDGKISSEQLSATGKATIISDRVARSQGTHTLDWNKQFYETKGSFSVIDGLIQTNNSFKADSRFNINMGGVASANVPKFVPLIGGTNITNSNFVFDFSNDGNLSNDFAAVWTTIQESFFGINIDVNLGFKGFFDGRLQLIASNLPPTNSFLVSSDTPWILLSADWENDDSDVQIRIEKPDGSFIEEADFAANNIAILDGLTDSDTRTAVVVNPTAGIWDIEVVDDTGLGDIEYLGIEASDIPSIEVVSPSTNVKGGEVTISYNAFDSDSDAQIKLFYDTDNEDFDGILITDELLETNGQDSFVWNTQGVAAGDYFIYAMIMDENNAPVYSYSTGQVRVTEAADLSVVKTIDSEPITENETFTYNVNVTNNGSDSAENVQLVETLPENVTFVSSSLSPSEQVDNVLTFDLGSLADDESTSLEIVVSAPVLPGVITGNAFVSSSTYDSDITNNSDSLTTLVEEIESTLPDLKITRTDNQSSVALGSVFDYTLNVKNDGLEDAGGVVFSESLPSGVRVISATTNNGSFASIFGNTVTSNLGTLSPGETTSIRLTVEPFLAGDLVSTTSVVSNQPDANPIDNELISVKTVSPVTPASADLELTQTVNDTNPDVGDQISITLTLANQGPGVASGIKVTDLLPPELSFVSASTVQGTYNPGTGVWDVGNLRDNLSRSLTIIADVEASGSLVNIAEVTAVNETDPDSLPANNDPNEDDQDSVAITVEEAPTPSGASFVFALGQNETLDGTPFQKNDLIKFDGSGFSKFFDGSDVKLKAPIAAVDVISEDEVLLSFTKNTKLPGIGSVNASDIVKFKASSLGDKTSGSFEMYFDGSDVGLSSKSENIDAVTGLADGSLLISAKKKVKVPGVKAGGEDLLKFTPSSLGKDTAGTWSLYTDGSDVDLKGNQENLQGVTVNSDGELLLVTQNNFNVPGVSGTDRDIFAFNQSSSGANTAGTFSSDLFFEGASFGLSSSPLNGIDVTIG